MVIKITFVCGVKCSLARYSSIFFLIWIIQIKLFSEIWQFNYNFPSWKFAYIFPSSEVLLKEMPRAIIIPDIVSFCAKNIQPACKRFVQKVSLFMQKWLQRYQENTISLEIMEKIPYTVSVKLPRVEWGSCFAWIHYWYCTLVLNELKVFHYRHIVQTNIKADSVFSVKKTFGWVASVRCSLKWLRKGSTSLSDKRIYQIHATARMLDYKRSSLTFLNSELN